MSLSISSVKEQLTRLGIDTSTPGLSGDERLDELNLRLTLAQNRSSISSREAKSKATASSTTGDSSSLDHLSMTDIRSRLDALGIDTSTPGMSGDNRRDE